MRPPCTPIFSKAGVGVDFEVDLHLVDLLVKPSFTRDALLDVLGVDANVLFRVLQTAALATKVHYGKIQKLRLKLEKEYWHLTGKERAAAELVLNREKEKEGAALGISVQLLGAVQSMGKKMDFTVSQYVFMEAITPATRTIVPGTLYRAWLETIESVIRSPSAYMSASHLASEYVFFDVESTGLLPGGRITCAVTQNGDDVRTWCSAGDEENTYQLMTVDTANELVEYLYAFGKGRKVVTFNGASFDFKMLYQHLDDDMMREKLIEIAKNHFDLHLACIESSGHRMALNGLVLATIGNESKGGSGLDAIEWWKKKNYDDLFEYCAKDVLLLKLLWQDAHDTKILFYLPKKPGSSRKAVAIDDPNKRAVDFNSSLFTDYAV